MQLLAAFDKFRGTLTATEACRAAEVAVLGTSWQIRSVPLADGGEGTLEALGGPNRTSVVTGPLSEPVEAAWRLSDGIAVIEMARASGLTLAGGPVGNDPERASTIGTGELIREAIHDGADRVIVGVGGSATTDGGWGAVEVLEPFPDSVTVEVACDVTTLFGEAAFVYGPQKGAAPDAIHRLTQRLVGLAETYRTRFGVDVTRLPGSGAAGGLAGGLAALGAELKSGFELIADHVRLADHLAATDAVLTGEGRVDATSWQGKVVGGVTSMAANLEVEVWVIAGTGDGPAPPGVRLLTLVEACGEQAAWNDTAACLSSVVADQISRRA